MFARFGLRFKLIVAFSISAVILGLVSMISYGGLTETVATYDHVAKGNFPKYVALSQIIDSGRRLNILINKVVGAQVNGQDAKVKMEEFKATVTAIDQAKKTYLSLPFDAGEEELWSDVVEELKACIDYTKEALMMARDSSEGEIKRRDSFANNYESVRVPYLEAMGKLMTFQSKEANTWSKRAEDVAAHAEKLLLVLAVCGVCGALSVGTLMSLSLSQSMLDLSQNLSHGADEVAAASGQISSTAEQLSSSSVEQASAIQETASSVEEMSSMVRKNAANAKRSADTARDGMESAETGKQVVTEMLKAMADIDAATHDIADVVKVIGQIENKTKVIDDIVFKTQLLSFNASVEAARAGEHGKGFAVVAEEVGNLAQMSGNAAREISEMLSHSLERVDRMIHSSKQKVELGLGVGKRCGEVLEDLVQRVSEINDMANDIAGASDEQARGVAEINKAMTQMDQMTQQNSAAAQQSAASSGELSQQAEALRASVASLLALIHGVGSTHQAAPLRPTAKGAKPSVAKFSKRREVAHPPRSTQAKAKVIAKVPSADHEGFDEAA